MCVGISRRGTGSPFPSVRLMAAVMEMMEVRAYQWRPTQTQPNQTKPNQTRKTKLQSGRRCSGHLVFGNAALKGKQVVDLEYTLGETGGGFGIVIYFSGRRKIESRSENIIK